MSGNIDPSIRVGHEPISDEQKVLLGNILFSSIRQAIALDRATGNNRNIRIFTFDKPELLLDEEGSVPQYFVVAKGGNTPTTRDLRVIVKKNGFHTQIPKTEVYQISVIKNTEIAKEVRKATLKSDHVAATQQDSGVSDEDLYLGAAVAAAGLGITTAEQAFTDVQEREVKAQLDLGECSKEEALYLINLFKESRPSTIQLIDIVSGNY